MMESKELKFWDMGRRPQDDVPTERIIHYIVKDYRRMFNAYHALLDKAKSQEKEINRLNEKNKTILSSWDAERRKFKEAMRQLQESRSAVVDAVTEDLEDEVKELKRQNRLLAEAVVNGNNGNVRVIREAIALNSPSEREWMKRSMKQLEQANMKLDATISHLTESKAYVENIASEGYKEKDAAFLLKKIGKAHSKLESALSHIATFFEKTSKIDFDDNTISVQ
ncbi:MAG: hypothetical protein IJR71_01565 [Prevotella sp.]|nr:hypothetical protein [Prevotella sp.]